ncbi:MAG TPA: TIGR02301 family protein [Hyphomonadaceae bacterium]|nr:TIGR02301 family protein [Hyphomonadaceae bacterium]
MARAQAGRVDGVTFHTPAPITRYRAAMFARLALCAIAAAAFAAPASAQEQRPAGQQQGQEGPVTGEVWYENQLSELAEVLGGAHYLRITCEGRRDQRWRDYMREVIAREPKHNALMVEAFNRGYREEESRFAQCDEIARQVEAELRARGLRVSQGLRARHAE